MSDRDLIVLTHADDVLGTVHHTDNIRVLAGNSVTRTIYVKHGVTRIAYDLSDIDEVELVVKADLYSSGFELSTTLAIADAEAGTITFALTSAQTLALGAGNYYYEIILVDTGTSRETVAQAELIVDRSMKTS